MTETSETETTKTVYPTGTEWTTKTIYTTKVYTVTTCPPGVYGCEPYPTTETYPVSTTVCTKEPSDYVTQGVYPTGGLEYVTETLYITKTITLTQGGGEYVTETVYPTTTVMCTHNPGAEPTGYYTKTLYVTETQTLGCSGNCPTTVHTDYVTITQYPTTPVLIPETYKALTTTKPVVPVVTASTGVHTIWTTVTAGQEPSKTSSTYTYATAAAGRVGTGLGAVVAGVMAAAFL